MRFVSLLVSLMALQGMAWAQGARPPIQGPALVAPFVVDGTRYDAGWIFPSADKATFFVEAEPLIETLKIFLPDDMIVAIRAQQTDKKVLSLASLAVHGMDASFDEKNLDLILEIPGKFRRHAAINVSPLLSPEYRNIAESSFYSGYLNARASDAYNYPANEGRQTRQPLQSNLELVNNIGGLVLETGADYTEKEQHVWQRTDSAASVDWVKRMVRFKGGDLQFPFSGYQSSVPIGGLSVSRQFSIQPYTATRPTNAKEIFLKRPSTVEIYVNGIYRTKLRLPAGPVDVRDFPLNSGLNNVQVKITDDLGHIETIQLSLLYDSLLLRRGLHEYAYNIGAPWTATSRDRIYDRRNLTSSFFHKVGVSDNWTVGCNFQADQGQRLGGIEQILMTRWGSFNTDAAGNWNKGAKAAWAGRVRYRSPEYYNGRLMATRLSLESEYKDLLFGSLSDAPGTNLYSWAGEAFVVHDLPWQIDLGAGYRQELSRYKSLPNLGIWKANLSKNLSSSWRINVDYSHTKDALKENRFFVNLSWTEQTGRYYATSSYDSLTEAKRIDVTRNPLSQTNDLRLSAGMQEVKKDKQADLQAEYIGTRALLRLDQQYYNPTISSAYHQSNITAATALAWTDSAITISRPISESFVILPAKKHLRKFNIAINHNGEYPEAETSWIGPAILPSVVSYNYTPVSVDSTRLPVGYSVGREFWAAKPRYKSGVTILIGGDATLIANGSLVDRAGQPIALAAGELFDAQGRSTGNSFFTNRLGQYLIENLKPGRYQLRFFDPQFKTTMISVAGDVGMVHVNPVVVDKNKD